MPPPTDLSGRHKLRSQLELKKRKWSCVQISVRGNFFDVLVKCIQNTLLQLQTANDHICGIGLMYDKLRKLYDERKYFWSRKEIDPEDTCNDVIKQKIVLMFGNAFLVLLHVAYVVFILSYVLFGKLDIWVPESHPKIAFALCIYGMTWGIFSVTCTGLFNLLIVSFCVAIQVQFQLINYRLRKMEVTWPGNNEADKKAIVKEIREISRHHSFLLT